MWSASCDQKALARIGPLALALVVSFGCSDAPRLIDSDAASGFALYRSGRLSRSEIGEICGLGVEEILVLDGQAADRECSFRNEICPQLRVRYNRAQDADTPVSGDFLQAFDSWIDEAQAEGRKVAFRCRHGWHRTGRLAAYYRIAQGGTSVEEARLEMQEIGRMMSGHPTLDPQVEAYEDLVAGRPCSTDSENCVLDTPDPGVESGIFPADVCASPIDR
jgi:hypothetical protein